METSTRWNSHHRFFSWRQKLGNSKSNRKSKSFQSKNMISQQNVNIETYPLIGYAEQWVSIKKSK